MTRWQKDPKYVLFIGAQIAVVAAFTLRGQYAEHFFDKMDAYATAIILAIVLNALMTDPKG